MDLLTQQNERSVTSSPTNTNNEGKKLNRRKSYEDMSNHRRSCSKNNEKDKQMRRPSEEAMLILDRCTDADMLTKQNNDAVMEETSTDKQLRKRKMSICYGSGTNLPVIASTTTATSHKLNKKTSNQRRRGEKLSLPARLQPWQRMEHTEVVDPLTLKATEDSAISKMKPLRDSASNGRDQKKIPLWLNTTTPAKLEQNKLPYDEQLLLEDDDLDNFIPTTDLAYNEFMPEGPSGYLIEVNDSNIIKSNTSDVEKLLDKKQTNNVKKSRRLSSPNFFKSPFSKNIKLKANSGSNKTGKNTPHESTSWEWYRLRKNEAHQAQKLLHARHSTTGSLDSSSLSEINFPTSSTQNSFRILEEAILSSGEALNTNNNKVNASLCSGSSSNDNRSACGSGSTSSTASSATKKKSRSFNHILRKVF